MRASSSCAAVSSSLRVGQPPPASRPGGRLSIFTSRNVSTVCGLLSSATSKSSAVRSVDRVAVAVGDDHVDAHEVDAGAEDRLIGGGRRLGRVGGRCRCGRRWRRGLRRRCLRRPGSATRGAAPSCRRRRGKQNEGEHDGGTTPVRGHERTTSRLAGAAGPMIPSGSDRHGSRRGRVRRVRGRPASRCPCPTPPSPLPRP